MVLYCVDGRVFLSPSSMTQYKRYWGRGLKADVPQAFNKYFGYPNIHMHLKKSLETSQALRRTLLLSHPRALPSASC